MPYTPPLQLEGQHGSISLGLLRKNTLFSVQYYVCPKLHGANSMAPLLA